MDWRRSEVDMGFNDRSNGVEKWRACAGTLTTVMLLIAVV